MLAAESAYFGLAFVNIGLMPDGGSTALLPAAVGKARAFQQALNRFIYGDLDVQLELEADLQHALGRTQDFFEGTAAFVEKRQAEFRGR